MKEIQSVALKDKNGVTVYQIGNFCISDVVSQDSWKKKIFGFLFYKIKLLFYNKIKK